MCVLRLRVILLLLFSVVVIIMFANARPNWAHQQVPGFSFRLSDLKFQFQLVYFFQCVFVWVCVCALIDCKFTTLALFCCVCVLFVSVCLCVGLFSCGRGNTSRKLNARKRLHDTLGLQICFVYIFMLVCV